MKKNVLILAFIFAFAGAFAQNSKRTSAYNAWRHGKLDEAKGFIDQAVEHEKTINDAKAWFYRGNIYYEIAIDTSDKFSDLDPNPFMVAYKSYKRAMELDEKNKYLLEIMKYMGGVANGFYQKGYQNFAEGNYEAAAGYFETSYEVSQAVDRTDTAALYNTALAYEKDGQFEMAKDKYLQIYEWGTNDPNVYESLGNVYRELGDNEKAFEYVEAGRKKFPDNLSILIAEINYYIKTNQSEQALQSLKEAVAKDSTNYSIWFAVGDMYDNLIDDTTKTEEVKEEYFQEAIRSYQNAIKLKQDFVDAYYNIGALYVDKAAVIQQIANDLPYEETEKYEKLSAEADEILKTSLPYLERAYQLSPDDQNIINSLKSIYARLNMMDKLEELNNK